MAEALYQPFPIPGTARGHVWHHVPATRRPRHFHAEPELNLIAAGQALFGVGDAIISVSAGDLLWWPPGQDHVLLDASSAVAEVLVSGDRVPFRRHGVPDEFVPVGPPAALYAHYRLDAAGIAAVARELIAEAEAEGARKRVS